MSLLVEFAPDKMPPLVAAAKKERELVILDFNVPSNVQGHLRTSERGERGEKERKRERKEEKREKEKEEKGRKRERDRGRELSCKVHV